MMKTQNGQDLWLFQPTPSMPWQQSHLIIQQLYTKQWINEAEGDASVIMELVSAIFN